MEEIRAKKRKVKSPLIQRGKMDITFFALVSILLTIGLVMLFSASYAYSFAYFGNSYRFIVRQAAFAVVGFILMMLISKIDYHVYRKFSWVVYIVAVALLTLLIAMPPMIDGVDYKRWIVVGGLTFQPSEIAKFAIVLLFSHLIAANHKAMKSFKFGILFFGFLLAVVCGLVVAEPHLSATVLIFFIGILLMVVGGVRLLHVGLCGLVGVAGGALAILTGIVGYGGDRIKYWLDPWADATGLGYQTIQSLLAVGSGGVLGKGLGQSVQKHLWVPEPHNDFIFSIVCEELGLIGAMIIIVLFCALVWRGFTIAMKAPDKFGALMAVGLTFQVGLQAILNILVVTNTIPNTGISLPFFSYGGTALLILLCEMGIVLSVSRSCSLQKA